MNKQEFFQKLKKYLRGFTEDEIKDILYDYEEHFTFGLNSGKTEEEIAEELGDPKNIAEQYKRGRTNTFEDNAKYYAEKAKETGKDLYNGVSSKLNKDTDLLPRILVILGLIIGAPFIIAALGAILGVFTGGIAATIFGLITLISSISMAAATTGLLTSLFIGTTWLSLAGIFLGILMTILSLYGFKLAIVLIKKVFNYITNKSEIYDKKPFMASKISKTIIVLLILFVVWLSIGLFQTIRSGLNLGTEAAPQLMEYLDNIWWWDNDYYNYNFTSSDNINVEKTASINGIETITTNAVISDIKINLVDSTELKATLSGQYKSPNQTLDLEINTNGNNLEIEEKRVPENLSFNGKARLVLNLYIPRSFTGNINFNTVSGDIESNEALNFKSINANTVSGDINIKSLTTENITINTTSGDAEFLSLISTNTLNFASTSGELEINNLEGSIKAHSISGDIKVNMIKSAGNSEISTTSGDVKLLLNENENVEANFAGNYRNLRLSNNLLSKATVDKNSGFIRFKDGTNKISISTISGDVTLDSQSY